MSDKVCEESILLFENTFGFYTNLSYGIKRRHLII